VAKPEQRGLDASGSFNELTAYNRGGEEIEDGYGRGQTPYHRNRYSRLWLVCRTWHCGGMAKNKIKAHSPNVLDYPSNMSMWERESLAAEAKLAAERKSKKKPSTKNLNFTPKSSAPE